MRMDPPTSSRKGRDYAKIKWWMQHYLVDNAPSKALQYQNIRLTFTLTHVLELEQLLELQQFAITFEQSSPFYRAAILDYTEHGGKSRLGVTMATIEHDKIARETEQQIRQQLYDGNNFYWGDWSAEGIGAVECLSAARVALEHRTDKKCRFRFPDGSLWIPKILDHPFIVVEVALSHDYNIGYTKCLEWMFRYKGKIKYAVLVKVNRWPKRKKGKGKGQGKSVVVAASRKRGAPGQDATSNSDSSKRSKSTTDNTPAPSEISTPDIDSSAFTNESEDVEEDPTIEALEFYTETDDEDFEETKEDQHDEDQHGEDQRRRKYKFKSVVVSVFKTGTSRKCDHIIKKMEVWPAAPPHPAWQFEWADMFRSPQNPKANATNTVSFDFLHAFFEMKMLRVQERIEHEVPEEDDSFSSIDP
ncbi:hypothetical protein K440DRAFT_665345 [Wilcoxina mikolae CBS 423.85]|nr:hypothetical protein K440DRAFT_665345 [Wilcoxina mikolae CBS 423.85]